ncbi:hypothetical protein [Ruminococcus sp.]|uniref:hypothetical protein n=1 Tax=Ruminococcus sp. TaxID=41978 RepID=UPI002E814D93|nr:hypothetical protein [Ruminococcus sp.]MEE3492743.1 hypothetical protein [Ruminococcus sp.]
MKAKNIAILIPLIIIIMILLCGCGEKAKYEAQLEEYNEKISSLKNDLDYYQNIYDTALSTYQKYSKYSGKPEWDSELDKTNKIMNEAQDKISSIKRDILLYEKFRDNAKTQLEKYK